MFYLLRVVMVLRAGAHVVCIWVYLNMNKRGRSSTEVWGNENLQYMGAGIETERVQRAYT